MQRLQFEFLMVIRPVQHYTYFTFPWQYPVKAGLTRLSNYCTRYYTGFLVTSFLVLTVEVIWRRRSSIPFDLMLFYLMKGNFHTDTSFKETYNDFTFILYDQLFWRMTVRA
jgi:hypothetical protein